MLADKALIIKYDAVINPITSAGASSSSRTWYATTGIDNLNARLPVKDTMRTSR